MKHIDIDHPGPELPVPAPLEPQPAADLSLREVESPLPQETPRAPKVADLAPNEYASPAFIKRARLSYGALYEDGLDIFEEDGGVKGKGRKRSRFGRESNAWRYSSQSPSPEPSSPVRDVMDEDNPPETPTASPKPLMMDEGVQTVGIDTIPTPESNESADHIMTSAPILATKEASPVPPEPQDIQSESSQHDVQYRLGPEAQREASHADPESRPPNQASPPDILPTNHEHAEHIPAHQGIPTTLFGAPKPVNPFSMFGTAPPTRMEPGSNFADQVRFGFSHIPQTTHVPQPPSDHGMSGFDDHGSAPYPEAFLNPSGPAQYANMDPYPDLPEHNQVGQSVDDTHMLMEPPSAGDADRAEWEVPAQPHYDSVDGLRFAPAALDGESEFLPGQHAYPFGPGTPVKVPEGFSSYGDPTHGPTLYSEDEEASSPSKHPHVRHNELVQNDETFDASQEAVAVDDDDDSIATDSNGEELEEGDYDQRKYNAPEDDEEGIPEEFTEEYDDEAIYDEDDADGESEEEEEGEEEDYESESHDEDIETGNFSAQPTRKPAPPSSAPVVIDLISDSEDDEPTPVPARRAPSPKNQQAFTPSEPPKTQTDFIDPMLARAAAMAQDEVDKQALDSAQHLNDGQDRIQVVDFAHKPAAIRGNGVQESVEDVDSGIDDNKQLPWGSHARPGSVDREGSRSTSEPYVDDGESSKDGPFVQQPRGQAFEEEDTLESGDAHSSDGDSEAGSPEPDETNDQDLDDDAEMDGVDTDDQSENGIESGEDVEIGDASEADGEDDDENDNDDDEEEVEEEDDGIGTSGSYPLKLPTFPSDAMEVDEESAVDDANGESEQLEQQLLSEADHHSTSKSGLATALPQQQQGNAAPATDASNADVGVEADIEPAIRTPTEEGEQSESKTAESRAATPVQQDMAIEEVVIEERVTTEETFIVEQHQILDSSTSFEQIAGGASSRTLAETEPSFQFSTQEHHASTPVESADEQPAAELKTTPTRRTRSMRPRNIHMAKNVEVDDPVASQSQAFLDAEETQVDNDTKAIGTPSSVDMDRFSRQDADSQASPRQETRATRKKRAAALAPPKSNDTRDDTEEQITPQGSRRTRSSNAPPSPSVAAPSSPDISVQLARQSVAAKRSRKAAPEPLRSSPRVTRARSSSLQTSPHSPEFEDNSVSLARAALASPSKSKQTQEPEAGTASLKADLTKHLRSFRECISLKSLRTHVDEHPNVLAVVTSTPAEPVRAKGGPREYVMSFTVTDPSMAPTHVVEVQLYRPHKESLPVVQPGDAILLQKFQVKALSNRGFGLRSHTESAWAVFDVDDGPPQVKGPPVEDYDQYGDHMMTLRAWYASLDEAAKGKLEKANKKLEEAGTGK